MRFAQVQMLHGLWGVVVFALFLSWALKRKTKRAQRFAEGDLLSQIAGTFSSRRQISKNILLVFVFLFSVLALARPQWGSEWQEVKRQGLDILIILDTSKSMLTEDVKPNRLERSKLAIKDLLKKMKGDRIGLMAFSGSAFLVCPLTVDYGGFLLALEDLNTNTIPRGGTNIAGAIQEAVKGYDNIPNPYKTVILMTDGESLEGDPLGAARQAKSKGIKIFTIGIGTQEGELIRIQNDQGQSEFLKDEQGNFIKSRLNEALLQQISEITDGVYVHAGGARFGLDVIYDEYLSKMEKREIQSKMEKKYHEKFQIPLVLAFVILLWETWLTTRKES